MTTTETTDRRFTDSLTTGNLWENIWRLTWPIFIMTLFSFFVGLTDVYVAGLIGPDVQAAVGFVSQIYFFIVILANAISTGTLALVARAVGEGDRRQALATARQSILFSLVVAICLTLPGFLWADIIVAAAGFPADTRVIASRFLRIFSIALGPNYVLIISNAVFRALGEVRKPLITMFVVSAVNIAGDFLLVFGAGSIPAMGYAGIAVSTALSVTAGTALNLILLTADSRRSHRLPLRISLDEVRRIMRIGWPSAMLQIGWNAGYLLLFNILGRLGSQSITAIASLTNGLRIEAVIYLPAYAFNMAASVLMGQNLGAGNPDRAEAVATRITKSALAIISFMSVMIFVFAEPLAALLTASPTVHAETVRYLRITMVSEPFMALSSVLGGSLQGAGDTRGTMWAVLLSMWFIRLPLAYIGAITLGYGPVGVWIAMITSMFVQGAIMAFRFRQGYWKEISL